MRVDNMTNAEYHAHPAISKSGLFKIADSPEKFRYITDNPPEKTRSLIFGSAFHKFVLEPDSFDTEFLVCPDINRRTKAGREAYQEFLEASENKEIITIDEFEAIKGMAQSVNSNRYARTLIEKGEHEKSYFWTDELTGEECKCRPDSFSDFGETAIITDLKSCTSAKTEDFMRDAIKFGYDLQAAMYQIGIKANTGKLCNFIFIAVEKEPPYALNILQADEFMIKRGGDLFRELIGIYHECKTTGNWYGYNGFSGMINNLSLPSWLLKNYE